MIKIGIVIVALSMLYIIVINMIMLIKFIICKDVKNCRNRECYVKEICLKYHSQLTQEECDSLLKLLDDSFKEERE